MRTRFFALVGLAPVLVVTLGAVARAGGDDDPPAEAPPPGELPALPALPELPPLPELAPLGTAAAPAATRALPAATAVAPPVTSPTLLSLPAVASAVLGQYDEHTQAMAAFSIDAEPVGARSYERCVAAGRCAKPTCAAAAGDGRVTCVDLAQARSYCAFAGERLPTEDEWEHAARQAGAVGMRSIDDAAEWTASPYCFLCGKDDQVVRGGPARNPALRGWRPPTTHDPALGFRCARTGTPGDD